jgi:hypothetical protein
VPLLLLAAGAWQQARGAREASAMNAEAAGLAAQRDAVLERRPERVRFTDSLVLPLDKAVPLLQHGVARLQRSALVATGRRTLALAGLAIGLLALLAGGLALAAPALAFWRGHGSPAALARAVARFAPWPPVLLALRGCCTLLGAAGLVLFELTGFLDLGAGLANSLRLLAWILVPAVFFGSWLGVGAAGRVRLAFRPLPVSPAPVIGRAVSQAEAPALWRFALAVAEQAGVPPPPSLVLALADRCRALPAGAALAGGTGPVAAPALLLPLPLPELLGRDGTAAVMAGEMARLDGPGEAPGALAAYERLALRLALVVDAREMRGPATLLRPAQGAAEAVRDAFRHLAERVRLWQALDADRAALRATNLPVAARTVVRASAAAVLIRDVLDEAASALGTAPPDLALAALERAEAGLPDPEGTPAEPAMSPAPEDPPLAMRLAALGAVPAAALLTARQPPGPADRAFAANLLAGLEGLGPAFTAELVRLAEEEDSEIDGFLREEERS